MLEYRKYIYGKFRCVLPRPNGLFRKKSRQPSNQQTLWPKFAPQKSAFPLYFSRFMEPWNKKGGEGIFPLLVCGEMSSSGNVGRREIDGIVLLLRRGGKSLPLQYKGFFLERGGAAEILYFTLLPNSRKVCNLNRKDAVVLLGTAFLGKYPNSSDTISRLDSTVQRLSLWFSVRKSCETEQWFATLPLFRRTYIRLLYSLKMQTTLSNPAKMLSTFRRKKSPEPFAF